MRKVRFIGILAIAIAAIGALGFLWLQDDSSTRPSEEAAKPLADADLAMQGLEYEQMRDGVKEWRLEAVSAYFLKDKNVTQLKDITVTFFAKDGNEVVMTAKEGRFYSKTQNIQVWGGVNVASKDGYSFKAPAVTYLAQGQVVQSVHDVVFKGPQFEVTGKGLQASVEQGTVTILQNVSATISAAFASGVDS